MRYLAFVLLLVIMSLAAGAASATPGFPPAFPSFYVKQAFLTPSGNIDCNAGPVIDAHGHARPGRYGLACVVFSASTVRGQATWYMQLDGRARHGLVPANVAADRLPRLAYGRSWAYHGFHCRSAASGLTCRNRQGHGFFLARERQRLF